ncbi:MAG: response regulator, partial [Clostridia bacterium]|nr:response regulator [Clostridia bacterium]
MFNIAFVDDNTDFLNTEIIIAKNYLLSKNINFKISEFKSGIDLLNHQEISSFDLILLDYEMEGMTGFETARLIRKNNYNVPIAFVTVFYEFSREG